MRKTKSKLYDDIHLLKEQLGFSANTYDLNAIDIAKRFCYNLKIEYISFSKIYAMLSKSKKSVSIALNSKRSAEQQNFDCCHELIHYFFHDNISNCTIGTQERDLALNTYIEWQANEGAAEFLVPYEIFIPLYFQMCKNKPDSFLTTRLAAYFNVSDKVIENRINCLKYEIAQYKSGIPLKNIIIMSATSQVKNEIIFPDPISTFCTSCYNDIKDDETYCKICGEKVKDVGPAILATICEGVNQMRYKSPKVNSDKRLEECFICHNTEITEGLYCKICGTSIRNICTNTEDECGGRYLDSNARYCPYCGHQSSFFLYNLLIPYNETEEYKNYKNDNTDISDLPF